MNLTRWQGDEVTRRAFLLVARSAIALHCCQRVYPTLGMVDLAPVNTDIVNLAARSMLCL